MNCPDKTTTTQKQAQAIVTIANKEKGNENRKNRCLKHYSFEGLVFSTISFANTLTFRISNSVGTLLANFTKSD